MSLGSLSAESRLPSALYADLFYTNQGAAEFRHDHLSVWLLVQLASSGPSIADDLRGQFEGAYPGVTLDDGLLFSVFEALERDGQIQVSSNGRYEITALGKRQVDHAESRFHASRKEFFEGVYAFIGDTTKTPVTSEERDRVADCTERILIRCLLDERASLEQLYSGADDLGIALGRARERAFELGDCLNHALADTLATRRIELKRGILSAIAHTESAGLNYLHTLHRSVISSFFLIQNPHHVENIRSVVRERIYYLDTNVYFAWLYRSQSAYGVVKPLLDLMRKYGVKLCILKETVEEIKRVESDARRAILRAEQDPSLAAFLMRVPKAISTDFMMARNYDKNLSLAVWEKLYTGVERLLLSLDVEIAEIDISSNGFDRDFDTFRNAIKGCKVDAGRFIRDDAIEHDARALLALASIQLTGHRDSWGSKARFMTLDSTLPAAIRELRNALNRRFEAPDFPFTLARILVPTASNELTREAYEDYVVSAVQQDLGVLTEMRGYTDFYLIDKLEMAGLPVRTLLAAPSEMVESVLADLQGRGGLGKRLDQVIATTNADEKYRLAEELNKEIAEAIAFGSDLLADAERQLLDERSRRQEQEQKHREQQHRYSLLEDQVARLSEQVQDHKATLQEAQKTIQQREGKSSELEASNRRLKRILATVAILLLFAVICLLVVNSVSL